MPSRGPAQSPSDDLADLHDTVIRNGRVIDGSGAPPQICDVAIDDGVITAVGPDLGPGHQDIDATGLIVTPGFVDIHTHYDGQVTWDTLLTPSSLHGVTTVVMGNCGVGFAPVAPDRHDWLIGLMEGVEDIPGSVLAEGMTWGWESFPEYLDKIDEPHAIDFAAQVPHDAVRTYVMGQRGADHESRATADELVRMRGIIAEALAAGAIGWSTGRIPTHKTAEGKPTPSMTAPPEELLSLARGMADAGTGVIDMISEFLDDPSEMDMIRDISRESKRPLSISILQRDQDPDAWRRWMDELAQISVETGSPIVGQVAVRAIGIMLGWDLTWHPFSRHPSYVEIAHLTLPERLAELRSPTRRAAILSEETATDDYYFHRVATSFDRLFGLGNPPNYEPSPDESVAAMARQLGTSPASVAYDAMLEFDGTGLLYFPTINYNAGNLDAVREMLARPDTVPALGDGGAHCGTVCDASGPTTLLTHWGRDRVRGERFDLEWLVKRHTSDAARTVGLLDRGLLAPGYKADINLIDFETLNTRHPEVTYDLPANGRRLMQGADGYVATMVSGVVTFRDGEHTGELPGRLVRGGRPAPA